MSTKSADDSVDPEASHKTGKADVENDEPDEMEPLLGQKSQKKAFWHVGPLGFIADLSDVFGHKLLLMLFAVQHLLKGLSLHFAGRGQPYLLRQYHVAGPQTQVIGSVIRLPWALKPIIGLVSDVLPISGYHKAPYLLMVSLVGSVSCFLVGVLSPAALSITWIMVFCFAFNFQLSACDLLSEAKYAEKMRQNPQKGSALMAYVWFGLHFAGFVTTLVSGPLLHYCGPKIMYIIAAIPAAAVMVPIQMGFMEESKVSDEQLKEIRARYWKQKEACMLCVVMLVCSIATMVCGLITRDPATNCIVAIVIGVTLLLSFSFVLSPVIAKFNAFSLIQTALSLSTGGASFYFFTDTPEMYPEGPHFSDTFYNSVLGVAGTVFTLFGIYSYQRWMSNWKYRHLLILTNVTLAIFSALDIMVFARLNKRIGIPDHMFVFGLSCIESVIAQWQWMPQVLILSYLCPKGMEATMYALLAGCHNMGSVISSNAGSLLLMKLHIQPRGLPGESAQFDNLWIASTISTVVHLLAIFILIGLLPDARQNEKILGATEEATTGSLWRRITSQ